MTPSKIPQPGDQLSEVRHSCGLIQSVIFAGASENYHRIHWDHEYARREGLSGAIVNSSVLMAWLEEFVEELYGSDIVWRNLTYVFKESVSIDAEVCCGGLVKNVSPGGQNASKLDIEMWIRGADGTPQVTARAIIEVFL